MISHLRLCRLQLVIFCLFLLISCSNKGGVLGDQQSAAQKGATKLTNTDVVGDKVVFSSYFEAVSYYEEEIALRHKGCADIAFEETDKMMLDTKSAYSIDDLNKLFIKGNVHYYTLIEEMGAVRNILYSSDFGNFCGLKDEVYYRVAMEVETLLLYCKVEEALQALDRAKEIYCNS